MDDPSDDADAELAPGATPAVARRGPGPMMRFLVVVFGVLLVGLGRAVFVAGGVGVVLGVLFFALAAAIIAIAVGLVEWVARRRQPG